MYIKKARRLFTGVLILTLMLTWLPALSVKAEKAAMAESLTAEERESGYGMYYPLGVLFQLPESFTGNPHAKRSHRGFDSTEKDLIDFSREYAYRSDALIAKVAEILASGIDQAEANKRLAEEVTAKQTPLFGFFTLNIPQIPESEEELKKALGGYEQLLTLGEANGKRQIFAKGPNIADQLEGEEKDKYIKLYDDMAIIEASIRSFPPLKPHESFGAVKNWSFEAKTLDGEMIDESFLKKAKLTYVVYWTTWCPDCMAELKTLGWYDRFIALDGDVQVLGVVADLFQEKEDEKVLEKARQVLDDYRCDHVNVFDSYELEEGLFNYAMNFPTSFFIDANGDILKVYVGEPELQTLLEDTRELLAALPEAETRAETEEEQAETESLVDQTASSEAVYQPATAPAVAETPSFTYAPNIVIINGRVVGETGKPLPPTIPYSPVPTEDCGCN